MDRPRPFYREQISNLEETWFLAAFFGEDLLRYVNVKGWAATWKVKDQPSPGHDLALGFEFHREEPVANAGTSSLFGTDDFSPNPFDEIDAGRSHTTTLSYSFDRVHWRSWTRSLVTAEVRVAGGALGGDQEFVRWEANATNTARFLRRLYADARLRAGTATGSLPFQEEFAIGGKGTLPGYRDHEFSGDRTLLLRSRVSWVPFGLPEQVVQYRLFVGLGAGNAWRVDDVPNTPRLRTSFAFGHGVYIPARFWIPFPVGISASWATPLDDDRGWRFHLNILGGAPR
jgi:hemolysin activation/secretion protein